MGQGLDCLSAPRSCWLREQAQARREGVTRNRPARGLSAPPIAQLRPRPWPRPTSVASLSRPAVGSAPSGSARILPAVDPEIGLWKISPSLVLLPDLCRVSKALFNPAYLPMYRKTSPYLIAKKKNQNSTLVPEGQMKVWTRKISVQHVIPSPSRLYWKTNEHKFPLKKLSGGNGNPLQYSCLENPRDRGA